MPDAKTIRELRQRDNDGSILVAEYTQKLIDDGWDRESIEAAMTELIAAAEYVKVYCE